MTGHAIASAAGIGDLLEQGGSIRVDYDTARLEQSGLLALDLTGHRKAVTLLWKLGSELGGAEQAAVLERIESLIGQEIQGIGLSEINAIMREILALQIAKVESHGVGSQVQENAAKPRLEQGGVPLAGPPEQQAAEGRMDAKTGWRPAAIRAAGNIKNLPVLHQG